MHRLQVWEIKAAELTPSPTYAAGASALNGKGIGARFPRFVGLRPDKCVA
jgi:ATP-dependent DNA ligase